MIEGYRRTYGLEIERPISNRRTAEPHPMSQAVFGRLADAARRRGETPVFHYSDVQPGFILGVRSGDLGEQGVDNGANLQETALPVAYSMEELSRAAALDTSSVQRALRAEGATAINMSIHPLGRTDRRTYQALVAPKSFYPYYWHRGFDHTVGIDGKSQNSPATGVRAEEAADAASVIIGTGAAFMGLFANGPFEGGTYSGKKEARGDMHARKVSGSLVEGDRTTATHPDKRFETLAEYFTWMYGGDTGIHYVIGGSGGDGYKNLGDSALLIDGNPSVLDYLAGETWNARFLNDVLRGDNSKIVQVQPDIAHMVPMQFAQQLGAKVRYDLHTDLFPTEEFLDACKRPNEGGVEDIFAKWAKYIYIEGRDPGNNLADREIAAHGDDMARSVIMAPSVIQTGLIRNLPEAIGLIDRYGWANLGRLRDAAVKDGLQGEVDGISVRQFTADTLEVAARGLTHDEQKMLAYPQWVLETGKNGADRALEFVDRHNGSEKAALIDLVKFREVVHV